MSQTSDINFNTEEQERLLSTLTKGHPDRQRVAQHMKSFAIDVPSIIDIDVMRHLEEKEVPR